jgi:hypothetical protein
MIWWTSNSNKLIIIQICNKLLSTISISTDSSYFIIYKYTPQRFTWSVCFSKCSFFLLLLPLWSTGLISQFLDHFTYGRTPWMGDQLIARPLPKQRTTQTQKNAHIHQTSMPWVGFEPMIPASERAKAVHALDCSVTVTGKCSYN